MSTRYVIQIADRQKALTVDRRFVRKVIRETLAAEAVSRAEISLAIVDDAEIRVLNAQYLQHDAATDVISFLLDCEESETAFPAQKTGRKDQHPRGAGKVLSGEVIVSTETAIREAEDYQWTARGELVLYIVHGLLHLCGYNDLTSRDLRAMRAREVELLATWDLHPPYTAAGAHAHL